MPGLTLEMKVRLPMTVTELAAKQVQFVRAVSDSLNVKLGAVTLVQIEEKGGGVEATTKVGAKDEAAGVKLEHAWNLKVFNAELAGCERGGADGAGSGDSGESIPATANSDRGQRA